MPQGEPDADIVDMNRWVLIEGQAMVADAGYVNMNEEQIAAALALPGE